MKDKTPIAVTSRSFSAHPQLRSELLERYSNVRFNDEGVALWGKDLIDFACGRRKLITALERLDQEFFAATANGEGCNAKWYAGEKMDWQMAVSALFPSPS